MKTILKRFLKCSHYNGRCNFKRAESTYCKVVNRTKNTKRQVIIVGSTLSTSQTRFCKLLFLQFIVKLYLVQSTTKRFRRFLQTT